MAKLFASIEKALLHVAIIITTLQSKTLPMWVDLCFLGSTSVLDHATSFETTAYFS